MPIVEYPFVQPRPGDRFRPMLHIRVVNPHKGVHFRSVGLLDTGADECAMPARFALLLGHDLKEGKERLLGTGNGVTTAYSHTCTIDILDTFGVEQGREEKIHSIQNAPVDFMPNLNTVLLGVGNFLSRFVLTIDYPRHVFSLRKP